MACILAMSVSTLNAAELRYVSGAVGNAIEVFQALVKPWEEATGHSVTLVPMPASTTDQFGQYRLWLAAGNADIDVYQTDVIWAPQLAEQFIDLKESAADLIPLHFRQLLNLKREDNLSHYPYSRTLRLCIIVKDLLRSNQQFLYLGTVDWYGSCGSRC